MALPIPIILSAGRAALSFSSSAASLTTRGIAEIGNAVGTATSATADFAKEFFEVSRGLQSLLDVAMSVYDTFLGSNEQINQSLLKSQTILSQTLDTYDLAGNKVDDLKTKISSFGSALREQQKVLEQDTKELVGVTSEFTLQVFDETLQRFGQLQGQTKEYATDLEGVTKLAGNITAALSSLNLTDQVQLAQETRALLQGDVNSPDSLLARNLGITREQFNQAKAQGELIDLLNEKLEPFRAGNALGSVSITNEMSNIQDAIDIFTRTIGEGLDKTVAVSLNEFRLALESALSNEELIAKSREALTSLISVAQTSIQKVISVGRAIQQSGILESLLDASTVTFSTIEGVITTVAGAVSSTGQIIKDAQSTVSQIVSKIERLVELAKKPIIITIIEKIQGKNEEPSTEPEAGPVISSQKLPEDAEFTADTISLIGNRQAIVEEVSLTRKVLGGFADFLRSRMLGGAVQEGLEADSNTILQTYSKLNKESTEITNKLVENFSKSANKFEDFSSNTKLTNSIDELSSFGSALDATETSLARLEAIDTLVDASNSDETRKALNELRNLEANASSDNVQARRTLLVEIKARLKDEAINIDALANELQSNIDKEQERLSFLISLRPDLAGAEQREQLEKEIATVTNNLSKLQDLGKVSGLADVLTVPKEALGPNADRIEQLLTNVEAGLSTIQNATQDADFGTGLKTLFDSLPEAINTGAIETERAKNLLTQLAESKKLTFEQQIQAEQLLTKTIKDQSQQRLDSLSTERSANQTNLSIGKISQSEFNSVSAELQTEEAIIKRQALQEELDALLRISNNIETQSITNIREQISQQTEAITQARANEILIEYQSAIEELNLEARQLEQFSQSAEQRIEAQRINQISLQKGGRGLTNSQANLNAQIEQRTLLKRTIAEARKELEQIEALQPGLSQTEQLEHQLLLRDKQIELVQKENQLAQNNLTIQQEQNALIQSELNYKLDTIKSQQDIADLQELILADDIESVSFAQNIAQLKREQLAIALQLQKLSQLTASTEDEQRTIETKKLALQKQLLQNQLDQKLEDLKLDTQQDELESRAENLARNKLSLDSKALDVERDRLDTMNEQLRVQKQLAKEAGQEAENKVKSLEAELDRLVAEGKAPKEAKRRAKQEQQEQNKLSRQFIENSLTGSAEEQNIQRQLTEAREQEAKAKRELKAIEKREAEVENELANFNELQIVNDLQGQGISSNREILNLNKELKDLNAKEQALADKGLLSPEQKQLIKEQKDIIVQEAEFIQDSRKLELEQAGITNTEIDKQFKQSVKETKELAKDQQLKANISELSPELEQQAANLAEEMAIQNAKITIAKANIEGLMQNSVNNAQQSVPNPSRDVGSAEPISSNEPVNTQIVEETNNAETVNITNNWGSLLDNRALARTRGV